jgi:hypothetical protein
MAYATTADLQDYLGAESELPADAGRLLERASELIAYVCQPTRQIETDEEGAAVLSKATCAQVEFWMTTDESHAILAPTGSHSIGSLSISDQPGQIAPRARIILAPAGLMRRRVRRQRGGGLPNLADSFFDPQLNPQKRY